jgi:polyisoprenoid-binding protein YceI
VLIGAIWFFFLRSDAPPPASLEEAVSAVTGEDGEAQDNGAADTTTPASTTSAPVAAVGLDGTWVVDQGLSFAGYRIGEELANLGAVTAVGRTSDIDAAVTFSGSTISDVSVTVDMTTLQSDRSRRDDAIRTRGLETNSFPTATFVLTEVIDLGSVPQEGGTINATAAGDLTLHGVTNSILIDLEGSLVGETMVVVGSADVTLTDYDIEAPTGFSVLSIADVGTFELQLAFVRG